MHIVLVLMFSDYSEKDILDALKAANPGVDKFDFSVLPDDQTLRVISNPHREGSRTQGNVTFETLKSFLPELAEKGFDTNLDLSNLCGEVFAF